jgi:hypothetical protein
LWLLPAYWHYFWELFNLYCKYFIYMYICMSSCTVCDSIVNKTFICLLIMHCFV